MQQGAKAWTICIATAAPHKIQVADILKFAPATLLAEELTGDHIKKPETLVVCSIHELKGFEFNCVIIIGCNKGDFPVEGYLKEETWRDALRLYVSMTRARDKVYLLFDSEPSEFLRTMEKDLVWKDEKAQGHPVETNSGNCASSGGLSSGAKNRIKDICHVDDDNSAWDWFTQTELDLLKNISRVLSSAKKFRRRLYHFSGLVNTQKFAAYPIDAAQPTQGCESKRCRRVNG